MLIDVSFLLNKFFGAIIFAYYFRGAMKITMKHTKGTKKIFSKEEAA